MRLLKALLILVFIGSISLAYGQKHKGVQFFNGSWEELLVKAKKENKPFFVDFYTSWCYPCKLLEKQTFSSTKVGDYTNKHFLAYRVNAESKQGIPLARKYGVRAYPTVLFFNSKGEVIGTHIGFVGPDQFLKVLEQYTPKKATGSVKKSQVKTVPANKVILEKYQASAIEHKKK